MFDPIEGLASELRRSPGLRLGFSFISAILGLVAALSIWRGPGNTWISVVAVIWFTLLALVHSLNYKNSKGIHPTRWSFAAQMTCRFCYLIGKYTTLGYIALLAGYGFLVAYSADSTPSLLASRPDGQSMVSLGFVIGQFAFGLAGLMICMAFEDRRMDKGPSSSDDTQDSTISYM
jgi:hypothetical protein